MPADQDLARIQAAIDTLSEHFDTVQIFATRHESGTLNGTVNVNLGAGNWFARYGQITRWTANQDERDRISERRED